MARSGSASTAGSAPPNGRSSSAQPSGVSQRSQPTVPEVSATARRSRLAATTTPPSSSATRRVGASWLATAPMPAKTDGDRGRREREVGRAAHGQPRDDEPGELGAPEDEHAEADRDELRGEGGAPSERAGEHELEAAGVLLGPERPHRGEEPVDRGRDRERPADAPGGIPADRGDVVRLAVEEAQPLVAGEAPREQEPARGRRVGPPDTRTAGCRRRPRTGRRTRACGPSRRRSSGRQGRGPGRARRRCAPERR